MRVSPEGWLGFSASFFGMPQLVILLLLAFGLVVAACKQDASETSTVFNQLPTVVQDTARAVAPNSEIDSVAHKTKDGGEVYEIRFLEKQRKPKVVITADGTLLSSDIRQTGGVFQRKLTPTGAAGTPLNALPMSVQKTIQTNARGASITNIQRTEQEGRVVYEVQFGGENAPEPLHIAEDGTVLQGEGD